MTIIVHDYLEVVLPVSANALVLERRSMLAPIVGGVFAACALSCGVTAALVEARRSVALGLCIACASIAAFFATRPRVERVTVDRDRGVVTLASGRDVSFASVQAVALLTDRDSDNDPIYAAALAINGELVRLVDVYCTSPLVVRTSIDAIARLVPEWKLIETTSEPRGPREPEAPTAA